MVKTIARVSAIDLGYDTEHVAYVTAVPAHSGRLEDKYLPATDRLLLDIAAMPGVEATAVRMQVPFGAAKPRAAGVIAVRPDLLESAMTLDDGRPVDRVTAAVGVRGMLVRPAPAFAGELDSGTKENIRPPNCRLWRGTCTLSRSRAAPKLLTGRQFLQTCRHRCRAEAPRAISGSAFLSTRRRTRLAECTTLQSMRIDLARRRNTC